MLTKTRQTLIIRIG